MGAPLANAASLSWSAPLRRRLLQHWRSNLFDLWWPGALAQSSGLATLPLPAAEGETYVISPDLPVIEAKLRETSGTRAAVRSRQSGVTPAILFSLPNEESRLICCSTKELQRELRATHGRDSFMSRLYRLRLSDGQNTMDYQVLPRMVHITAATDKLENVTFMHCPKGRRVSISVPLKLIGEDTSPGAKQGGFVMLLRRWIKVKCTSEHIPPWFPLTVSHLNVGDVVFAQDLDMPEGTQLVGMAKTTPIVKMTGGGRGGQ